MQKEPVKDKSVSATKRSPSDLEKRKIVMMAGKSSIVNNLEASVDLNVVIKIQINGLKSTSKKLKKNAAAPE